MSNITGFDVNANSSMRMGKDLQSPLVNLILAASLLSKFTTGKVKAQPHPVAAQPLFWYPPTPLKQQIIHIHQTPIVAGIPCVVKRDENSSAADLSTPPIACNNIVETIEDSNDRMDSSDPLLALSSNITDGVKTFLVDLVKKNVMDLKEQPEVETISQHTLPDEEVSHFTALSSKEDLETAAAQQKPSDYEYVLDPVPYETDSDEPEDNDESRQKYRPRTSDKPQRKLLQRKMPRVNSKRPAPRRTTPIALIYDEEYENREATAIRRRKLAPTKRNLVRRPTTTEDPNYDFDDVYEPPTRKPVARRRNPGRPRTTTPAYDYYYDNDPQDVQYEGDAVYEEQVVHRQKVNRRPSGGQVRQRPSTTTAEAVTTEEITTVETTLSPTTVMSAPTTPASNTTAGYPYAGQDNSQVSFTYGPPGQGGYPGPSGYPYPNYASGRDQVSFTYAPSLAGSGAAIMDNWYNQYARTAMFQRISDLLMPNSFYNQYDVNYNDHSF